MKPVNLDELESLRPTITKRMPDGEVRTFEVLPVCSAVTTAIQAAMNADGAEALSLYAQAVQTLVPDMPEAVVQRLSMPQLAAIVKQASVQVEIVEEAAADPNAKRPATKRQGAGRTR